MSEASLTSTQIGSPIFTSTPLRPKSPIVVTPTVVDSGIGATRATTGGVTTTVVAEAEAEVAETVEPGAEAEAEADGGETDRTEPLTGTIFSETLESLEPLPTTRIIAVKKRKTISSRAGLTLNVRRIHKYLKAGKYAKRVSGQSFLDS